MAMQRRINVMVNGLPGKMAREVAKAVSSSEEFQDIGYSLTGPEFNDRTHFRINDSETGALCFPPITRENEILAVKNHLPFISIDYTHPSAVNGNADFYCRHGLPFVMGTTGGDRKALEQRVRDSEICAVIAPNMAMPIVSLMDFMDMYSKEHEGGLAGCKLDIEESHQSGKADTSGTAKAMLGYFRRLGIKMDDKLVEAVHKFKMEKPEDVTLPLGYDSKFTLIRNPRTQLAMGVREEHLGGHGWHIYRIRPNSRTGILANTDLGVYLATNFLTEENPALKDYLISEDGREVTAISPGGDVLLGIAKNDNSGLRITHNINGRSVYVDGTLEAVRFLQKKVDAGEKGKVYSMIDVLRGE